MVDLRAIATGLGATDATTYIASGNLICSIPGAALEFDTALERAIEARFGFFREVISRSLDEMRDALEAHPFPVLEPRFSSVTFLAAAPTAAAIERAAGYPTFDDEWRVIGREQHVRYAGGAGSAQMSTAPIARTLGVAGTARNLLTVRKLIDLAS